MRNLIRAEVSAISPCDELEREHQAVVLAWIDSGVELCRLSKPAMPPMHLVSYFVVIDADHILLADHKNAQLWLPTGGHVEPNEHPRTTVIRELREELDITQAFSQVGPPQMITVTQTVGLTSGHTDVSLWYTIKSSRLKALQFDQDEFNAVKWFHYDAVPFERSDPYLKRFIGKLKRNEVG